MSLLQLGQESDKLRARNRDAVALLMQLVSDGRDQEILGGSSRVPGGCWTPNLQLLWGSEPSPHSHLPSGGLDVGAAHPPALDWYSGSAGPARQSNLNANVSICGSGSEASGEGAPSSACMGAKGETEA